MALVLALTIIISSLFLLRALLSFVEKAWWTPINVQRMMRSQGIEGVPYAFPHGNTKLITAMRNQSMNHPMDISHDIFSRIQPHVASWIEVYGKNFINWHGSEAQIFVTEPELVKEVLNNREGAYPKMEVDGFAKKLLGEALITNEGEKWAKVRKLANHTFHAESLKNMIPEMSKSFETMLEKWKDYEGQEIDVHKEFGLVTTDVISRTAFGSSYIEGKHIFDMVAKLTSITVRNMYKLRFPEVKGSILTLCKGGGPFLPLVEPEEASLPLVEPEEASLPLVEVGLSTSQPPPYTVEDDIGTHNLLILKTNDEIEAEKLEKAIKISILDIVGKRKVNKSEGVDEFGSDYLGQLVKIAYDPNGIKRITIDQMIDELKAIYGAGHLTTTSLLSWTVFLLAINQDWQDKVREEVYEFFGRNSPTSDGIARLKNMNMVINESLRLYPPVITMTRKVDREIKLGNFTLPANVNIFMSLLALHHNPEIWGNDVHYFRPGRFANGVARATNNNAAAFFPSENAYLFDSSHLY
ncbi:cytochrome P450 CYP749A22-like protein [Tanacetum coccineum]